MTAEQQKAYGHQTRPFGRHRKEPGITGALDKSRDVFQRVAFSTLAVQLQTTIIISMKMFTSPSKPTRTHGLLNLVLIITPRMIDEQIILARHTHCVYAFKYLF